MSARVNKPEKMKKQVKRRNDAKQFESLLYMGMNGISELKWVPFKAAVVKRKEKKVAPQTATISPAVVLPQKKGRTSLSIRELLNWGNELKIMYFKTEDQEFTNFVVT